MKMSTWERLERYGHIKNFKRKDDPRRFNAYLENGLIRIECNHGPGAIMTIDSFLYLFMENIHCCDYPQYKKSE